jgi:carboxyl-terminal processing protease
MAAGIFMRLASTLLFAFAILASTATADDAKAPDAKAELQGAIDLLKAHHMNSASMDWPTLEAHANTMIAGAKTAADAYPAIYYLIQQTHEKHTGFIEADSAKAIATGKAVGNRTPLYWNPPQGFILAEGVGVITISSFLGSPEESIAYTHAARDAVAKFAAHHICRFVVDLRGNGGGTMYPMINGLSALLGPEPYGYWQITGESPNTAWAGMSGQFKAPDDRPLSQNSIALLAKDPVAILIDHGTGSAGEFTAMAFEGRTNIRVFGEPSAGYITVNHPYDLPDGAQLLVSGGWATDRLHREYRQRIVPDEETDRGQATLDAAIAWLNRQPCRG